MYSWDTGGGSTRNGDERACIASRVHVVSLYLVQASPVSRATLIYMVLSVEDAKTASPRASANPERVRFPL